MVWCCHSTLVFASIVLFVGGLVFESELESHLEKSVQVKFAFEKTVERKVGSFPFVWLVATAHVTVLYMCL